MPDSAPLSVTRPLWLLRPLIWASVLLLAACAILPPTAEPERKSPHTATPIFAPVTTPTPEPSSDPIPPTVTAEPSPAPKTEPLAVFLSPDIPWDIAGPLGATLAAGYTSEGRSIALVAEPENASAVLQWGPLESQSSGKTSFQRTYVLVVPFATVRDEIRLDEFIARWQGSGKAPLLLGDHAADVFTALYGEPGATLVPESDLLNQLQNTPGSVGLIPFDQVDPTYKVLQVDGINPLSNAFEPVGDPLTFALTLRGPGSEMLLPLISGAGIPQTNRDPALLASLAMTGVTAMARLTAARVERHGYDYPARHIADELTAADITHVSNEIPFIKGCKVNPSTSNLTFCSKPAYWAALQAIGADIVGLSGNHVNDFGRKGARESIAFYRDNGISIYGSGLDTTEACAPLMWEHNGNRFAFIAALAYWPKSAWATDTKPGACYYYDNKATILETVQKLSLEVDIVSVELQHYETYHARPTAKQVREFRELRQAGADILTGVQSHVPQAMEPYGHDDLGSDGIIVYGLGNLFFDQMWSWNTRSGLIARHIIYDGRLINTEILTTMLHDYAQPRWANSKQRTRMLRRVFQGTPDKPNPS
ncbi:MAG: hypothetical protein GY759_05000 [Chloroflexi bacterium]|nr:hypothetical protein [Chloroflexota bacterium]